MPSASMYASPYIHKEPPPRIDYPTLFSGFNKITFRYFLDSKVLALAALVLIITFVVIIGMAVTPFWFTLVLNSVDGTFGSEPIKDGRIINTGLFYMNEEHFDNIAFLNKYSNRDVVPKVLSFAQTCAVFSNCLMTGCMLGTFMLMLRRFGSVTATITLAGVTTLAALLQILSILFCGILVMASKCAPTDNCYTENLVWRMIPMYTQFYRVEPHLTPYVKPNWAFYIAIIGCILLIAAAILLWIEALIQSKNLSGIRYQQLREARDPYAFDVNPMEGKKYVYTAPERYGPNSFGMQPVVHTGGYYTDANIAPPAYQPGPGPAIGFVAGQSKPYRPESESGSSFNAGTREIDL